MKNLIFVLTLLFSSISCTTDFFTLEDDNVLRSSSGVDLTGQNFSINSDTVTVGSNTPFSINIVSSSLAKRSYVAYYLATDTTIQVGSAPGSACTGGGCLIPTDPDYIFVGTDKCYSNPNSYESHSLYINPSFWGAGKQYALGDYYLIAVADYRQEVFEVDENNNVEVIAIHVTDI